MNQQTGRNIAVALSATLPVLFANLASLFNHVTG